MSVTRFRGDYRGSGACRTARSDIDEAAPHDVTGEITQLYDKYHDGFRVSAFPYDTVPLKNEEGYRF